jgi:site-specific DNA recombinase
MGEKTSIAYARVSTVRQAEEELPLESQLEQCRRKARDLGADLLEIFTDEGMSGRLHTRPGFQDAISYCRTYKPDYLITWSSSRFARNQVDAGFYKAQLKKYGTRLVYASMEVDRSTIGGWLLDSTLEMFDELYSRQISADTRRSLIKNARGGYWNGGQVPFGLRAAANLENPKRKRLEAHPEEAELVEAIFRLRVERGLGARSLALWLNERGYWRRGKRWNKNAIHQLLRNQAVIGKTVFNRKDRATGQIRPRDEWIIVDSHPPVVSMSLWNRVQKQLDADQANTETGSPHSTYFFTGLLRCGECGGAMQIESAKGRSKRYWYYHCKVAALEKRHRLRRIPARELDEWLIDVIGDRVFSEEAMKNVLHELNKAISSWAQNHKTRRQAAIDRIRETKQKVDQLYQVLEAPAPNVRSIWESDILPRLSERKAQIKELERELAKIEAEQPPQSFLSDSNLDELSAALVGIIKTSENPKKVRAFFQSFIESIYIQKDRLVIKYDPAKLVMVRPGKVVPSNVLWLPGTGSNRRPSD